MKTLAILLAFAGAAAAQTVGIGAALPQGIPQFFADNGRPAAGYKLCTYQAGTSTPLTTYQDSQLTMTNANPMILNSAGRPQASGSVVGLWTNYQSYKIVLLTPGSDNTCSTGSTVWSEDNVTAPIPAINGGIVNVLSYGAKCDGSTDDASSFTSAIGSGNNVLVPGNRTCVIGSALTMGNNNQALIGQNGVVLQRKSGFSGTLVTVTATSDTVQNIIFDCNSQGTSSSICVRGNGATAFQFLNNQVQNTVAGEYAFRCDSCVDFLIQGNVLKTGILGTGLTVFATSSKGQVVGNTVVSSATGPNVQAFDVEGGAGGTAVLQHITITGNSAVVTTGFCYQVAKSGGSSSSQIAITSNTCAVSNSTGTNGCTNVTTPRACGGISIPDSTDSLVANNTIYANGQNIDIAGIEFGSRGMTIMGNTVYAGGGSSGSASGIQGYCLQCRIIGNSINGWSPGSSSAGIKLTNNGSTSATVEDDNLIANNTVVFTTGVTGQFGIYFDCALTSSSMNRANITSNTIVGPSTASNTAIDLFAGDAAGCTIADPHLDNNQIYNISAGLQLPSVTTITAFNNRFVSVTTPITCSGCSYQSQNIYGSLAIGKTTAPVNPLDVSGKSWFNDTMCMSSTSAGGGTCTTTSNVASPLEQFDSGDGSNSYRYNLQALAGGGFSIDAADGGHIKFTATAGTVNYMDCNAASCLVSHPQTSGGLPTCNAGNHGMIANVTDSSVTTWGSNYSNGGTNKEMVYCNGANWTVMGK